jgi:hypothetical protein
LGSNSATPLPNTGNCSNRPTAAAAAAAVSQAGSARVADPSAISSPHPPRSSRREADFKAAWDLLQRSLACFLKDKAAKNGMQLPSAWNPLAWLVVYCAVVKRDTRQDGKLVAVASHRTMGDAAPAALDYSLEHDVDSSCFRSMAVPAGTGSSSAWVGNGEAASASLGQHTCHCRSSALYDCSAAALPGNMSALHIPFLCKGLSLLSCCLHSRRYSFSSQRPWKHVAVHLHLSVMWWFWCTASKTELFLKHGMGG